MLCQCNYRDGLCDIPEQKSQIKIDNYIAPIPHPSIYPTRIPLAQENLYTSTPSTNLHLHLSNY